MKAKTLKWKKVYDDSWYSNEFISDIVNFQYFIYIPENDKYIICLTTNGVTEDLNFNLYNSLKEAKQAAQEHFNNFVAGLVE